MNEYQKIKEAVKLLQKHNAWRLGSDKYEMHDPKEITEAIKTVCDNYRYLFSCNFFDRYKKQGEQTQHLAIEDAGQQELLDWLKALIDRQGISIFETGKITTVEVRESVKGENGKTISFSFKGLTPARVAELIVFNINKP